MKGVKSERKVSYVTVVQLEYLWEGLCVLYYCSIVFLYQVQEQYEKESVLLKELERLRLHLVAVEEGYTQEALKTEEQVKDLQNKLAQAEERIRNSSTAYTSARLAH